MEVLLKYGVRKMENEQKKHLLKTIGIIRECIQNNMQLSLENYYKII